MSIKPPCAVFLWVKFMSGKTKVKLYGVLKKFIERKDGIIELYVSSPREAIKALTVILPGFERFMIESKKRGLTFAVFKGERNISKDELNDESGTKEIRIIPIPIGSKRAGVFQTVLGVVLIAVAAYASGGVGAAFAAGGWSGAAAGVGASLVIGGVAQMMAPQQSGLRMREDADNKPSYAFGGPVNTTAQGNPVGLLYGQREIGGAVISAGIFTEDQQ